MKQHKFKIGQEVTLVAYQFDPKRHTRFEVIRVMPTEHWVHQYRLKSVLDGHERVATESELDQAA